MKRDLRGTVAKVARFLDIRASDALIDEVCRLSSFEYMKQNDRKFADGQLVPWREPGAMIRKGAQGGSSEMLTPGAPAPDRPALHRRARRLGSDFPYEEFCDLAK